jgi:hypothetical protein
MYIVLLHTSCVVDGMNRTEMDESKMQEWEDGLGFSFGMLLNVMDLQQEFRGGSTLEKMCNHGVPLHLEFIVVTLACASPGF